VYGVGTEPDPRFSLANERTYLAWVRTERALRQRRSLPGPSVGVVVVAGVAVGALILVAGVFA
jgi:putative membrane protein